MLRVRAFVSNASSVHANPSKQPSYTADRLYISGALTFPNLQASSNAVLGSNSSVYVTVVEPILYMNFTTAVSVADAGKL